MAENNERKDGVSHQLDMLSTELLEMRLTRLQTWPITQRFACVEDAAGTLWAMSLR